MSATTLVCSHHFEVEMYTTIERIFTSVNRAVTDTPRPAHKGSLYIWKNIEPCNYFIDIYVVPFYFYKFFTLLTV